MDIRAYNQRIESLKQKSDQLEDENFHDIDTITKRYVFRLRFVRLIFVHWPISSSQPESRRSKIRSENGQILWPLSSDRPLSFTFFFIVGMFHVLLNV